MTRFSVGNRVIAAASEKAKDFVSRHGLGPFSVKGVHRKGDGRQLVCIVQEGDGNIVAVVESDVFQLAS